jgi:hypothetical protein
MSIASPLHLVARRTGLLASLMSGLLIGAGCTGSRSADSECGGHGELHGDHCHCDSGYTLSTDKLSCVARTNTGKHTQDAGLDTAQYGGAPMDAGVEADAGQASEGTELVFAPATARGRTGAAEDGTLVWLLDAVDGDAVMGLELYEAYGGPTSPGVVDIAAAETSYATCGTCLLLQTGCTPHGDHFHCARTFMPRAGGRVQLQAMGRNPGERLTGELLDVVFQEVSIDSDLKTQPVAGGAVLHLDAWAFDVGLDALGQ